MQLNFQRLGALIRKETIQILRDRRFIMLFLGLTFVQLFVYSYSASRTVYHLPMAAVDQSLDATSRAFVQAILEAMQEQSLPDGLPSSHGSGGSESRCDQP